MEGKIEYNVEGAIKASFSPWAGINNGAGGGWPLETVKAVLSHPWYAEGSGTKAASVRPSLHASGHRMVLKVGNTQFNFDFGNEGSLAPVIGSLSFHLSSFQLHPMERSTSDEWLSYEGVEGYKLRLPYTSDGAQSLEKFP